MISASHMKHYLFNVLKNLMLLLVVAVSIEWVYYRVTPIESYVEYASITSKEPLMHYQNIRMRSKVTYHNTHPIDISWTENIFCDINTDQNYNFVIGQFFNKPQYTPTTLEQQVQGWDYHALDNLSTNSELYKQMSTMPISCYLDSHTTINLEYGIKKHLRQQSDKFKIFNNYNYLQTIDMEK